MRGCLTILSVLIFINSSVVVAQNLSDSVDCRNTINFGWCNVVGTDTSDAVQGVCSNAEGNVYVTGYFNHTMQIGETILTSQGAKDIFIVKYSADGDFIWALSAGGIDDDYGKAIACNSTGDIFVTGMFTGSALFDGEEMFAYALEDAFIVSYNGNGDMLWFQPAGGWHADSGSDIKVDARDNVLVTGTFNEAMGIGSTTLIGNGQDDCFAAKFRSNGSFLWAKKIGSSVNDESTSIAFDHDDNVFVTGVFTGTLETEAETLTASGTHDGFIAAFNAVGEMQWIKQVGSDANNDRVNDVTADGDGNVIVAGFFDHDDQPVFVRKYDAQGTEIWTKLTGGDADASAVSITSDLSNNLFVTGWFSGTAVFGNSMFGAMGNKDAFFIKISHDSEILMVKTMGSGNNDEGRDVCLDYLQNIIVGGLYSSNIYIEGSPYTSEGLTDGFVIKYNRLISMGNFTFSGIGCDDNNLCAQINMLQGAEPYSYYWSTGDATAQVCGLSPADYTVTVVDQNNCYIDTVITVLPSIYPEPYLPEQMNICPFDTVNLDAGEGMQTYLWSTGANTQFIEVSGPGAFSVTVTNEYECELVQNITVSESAVIELFGIDTVFTCFNVPVTLSLQGVFSSYLWNTGSTLSTITADHQGTYYVRAKLGQCYYYDTVYVRYYPQPEISLGEDRVICSGDFIYFEAPPGFVSYLWQNGSTEDSYTCTNEGPVTLTVTDANGCSAYDSIYVSLGEYPEVNLGPDQEYCDNDIPVIDAGSGFVSYLWSDASSGATISPETSGTYSVTVTNQTGCTAADTISVTVRPAPEVSLGADVQTCANNEVSLSPPSGFTIYEWSTGASMPILNVTESGEYSLTVHDEYGCTAVDTVEVNFFEVETPFLGFDFVSCDSAPLLLDPDGYFKSYLWQNGSDDTVQLAVYPGVYSLTVTDFNGCTSSDNITISHADSPVLTEEFSASGRIVVNAAGGTPPYSYSVDGLYWSPVNSFNQLLEDWYNVYVSDSNSCKDTIRVYVDNNIIIPEFFTPNGDGYNDTWEIIGIFRYPNADITIFDRFGKQVAKYKGNQQGWNGIYARQPVAADTYWYIIMLNSDMGESAPFKGPVTIIR
ncbi:MAG TPA: T9SS type B sorting domain-containing protein [Bacteroidales bacterium]|nr:T9SS type B sorting domain-containing protein [Bacteroidales bacterium]